MRMMGLEETLLFDVAGTTHVKTGEVPQEALAGVWLDGVAIQPCLIYFYWVPVENSSFERPGLGCAVVTNRTDRAVTTVAWLI